MDQYVQFGAADHHSNQVRTWLIRFPTSLVLQDHRFFFPFSATLLSHGQQAHGWQMTWMVLNGFWPLTLKVDMGILPWRPMSWSFLLGGVWWWLLQALCAGTFFLGFVLFDSLVLWFLCVLFSFGTINHTLGSVCLSGRESLGNNAECSFGPTFLAIFTECCCYCELWVHFLGNFTKEYILFWTVAGLNLPYGAEPFGNQLLHVANPKGWWWWLPSFVLVKNMRS